MPQPWVDSLQAEGAGGGTDLGVPAGRLTPTYLAMTMRVCVGLSLPGTPSILQLLWFPCMASWTGVRPVIGQASFRYSKQVPEASCL